MTAPALWPSTLPLRANPGMRGQTTSGRFSFQPDEGYPIDRPRTSSSVQIFDMTLPPLTVTQFDAFDTFYRTTLSRGTDYFGWIHPRSLKIRRVKIVSEPTERHVGRDYWQPSFQLLVPDVTPPWAGYLTTANGYMQIVDQPAWDAL